MNPHSLEKHLREKIPTETPRPGFETRIQAMAREPHNPKKKPLLRRLAIPALAILTLIIVFNPKDKPSESPIATSPDPVIEPQEKSALTKIEEPVQREIQGLKNDAAWTMGLFKKALPSVSLDQKKID